MSDSTTLFSVSVAFGPWFLHSFFVRFWFEESLYASTLVARSLFFGGRFLYISCCFELAEDVLFELVFFVKFFSVSTLSSLFVSPLLLLVDTQASALAFWIPDESCFANGMKRNDSSTFFPLFRIGLKHRSSSWYCYRPFEIRFTEHSICQLISWNSISEDVLDITLSLATCDC